MARNKKELRERRCKRVRSKIEGTLERPRMTLFKSNKYIYVQLIDDIAGKTLASASSLEKSIREGDNAKVNLATSEKVGKLIGERAVAKGIKQVVFDRGPYAYHGNVKKVADAAREAGLDF